MAISLTTTEREALIGRELDKNEVQNFDLFLNVATLRLNNLLSRDIAEIIAPEAQSFRTVFLRCHFYPETTTKNADLLFS